MANLLILVKSSCTSSKASAMSSALVALLRAMSTMYALTDMYARLIRIVLDITLTASVCSTAQKVRLRTRAHATASAKLLILATTLQLYLDEECFETCPPRTMPTTTERICVSNHICQAPYFAYDTVDDTCLTTCPLGTRAEELNRVCIGSPVNDCDDGKYFLREDTCVESCPSGTGLDEFYGVCFVNHPCTEPWFFYHNGVQSRCLGGCPARDYCRYRYTDVCRQSIEQLQSA